MIINKRVDVIAYPYTDPRTNKIVHPPKIQLDQLDVTFIDKKENKSILAKIKGFPAAILIYGPKSYESLGDNKSESVFVDKLLKLLGDDPSKFLQSLIPKTLELMPNGTGSILSGMLSSLGIRSAPTCSCKRRALEMNEKGPDWCENNLDMIVGWLEEEAKKRKLPFIKTVAKLMVQRAISKSRRLLSQQTHA